MAAVGEEAPGLLEAVLPAGQVRVLRAHVLEEEQFAARFEDAGGLGERRRRVRHRAEHEGEGGGVEAGVREGQPFGRRIHHLRRSPRFRSQLLEHVRVRLGEDQLGDRVGIEAEVGPRAAADVDRATPRRGERLAAPLAQSRLFARLEAAVVERREAAAPGGVVETPHAQLASRAGAGSASASPDAASSRLLCATRCS